MKEAEIGYSDIPPLDKSFFTKATEAWPPVKQQLTIRLDGGRSELAQVRADLVYMLDIYAKNEKSDLNAADKSELRKIVAELEKF